MNLSSGDKKDGPHPHKTRTRRGTEVTRGHARWAGKLFGIRVQVHQGSPDGNRAEKNASKAPANKTRRSMPYNKTRSKKRPKLPLLGGGGGNRQNYNSRDKAATESQSD